MRSNIRLDCRDIHYLYGKGDSTDPQSIILLYWYFLYCPALQLVCSPYFLATAGVRHFADSLLHSQGGEECNKGGREPREDDGVKKPEVRFCSGIGYFCSEIGYF